MKNVKEFLSDLVLAAIGYPVYCYDLTPDIPADIWARLMSPGFMKFAIGVEVGVVICVLLVA